MVVPETYAARAYNARTAGSSTPSCMDATRATRGTYGVDQAHRDATASLMHMHQPPWPSWSHSLVHHFEDCTRQERMLFAAALQARKSTRPAVLARHLSCAHAVYTAFADDACLLTRELSRIPRDYLTCYNCSDK